MNTQTARLSTPAAAERPSKGRPPDHAQIASSLVPLRDAGWTVTVAVPDDHTEDLGWRVSLDKPGTHLSFRVKMDASVAEWNECIRKYLSPSH